MEVSTVSYYPNYLCSSVCIYCRYTQTHQCNVLNLLSHYKFSWFQCAFGSDKKRRSCKSVNARPGQEVSAESGLWWASLLRHSHQSGLPYLIILIYSSYDSDCQKIVIYVAFLKILYFCSLRWLWCRNFIWRVTVSKSRQFLAKSQFMSGLKLFCSSPTSIFNIQVSITYCDVVMYSRNGYKKNSLTHAWQTFQSH